MPFKFYVSFCNLLTLIYCVFTLTINCDSTNRYRYLLTARLIHNFSSMTWIINPAIAHVNKIGVFIITIFPHAKKWISETINKIKHWNKIPKSAGHVGLPSSGPYFQTKIVPPIIITWQWTNIIKPVAKPPVAKPIVVPNKIDKKNSFAPNPSPWLFVSFNGGACNGCPSLIKKCI